MTGDREHLRELLLEKRFLQKHFEWLENLTGPAWPPAAGTPTFWRKRSGGYLWEGGASGMDNTPRGRTGPSASMPRPNNPRMFWLDAISQQALSASCISTLAGLIGAEELAAVWQGRYETFRKAVNCSYWCEEDGFYYDIDGEDGSFYKVVTPALNAVPSTAITSGTTPAVSVRRRLSTCCGSATPTATASPMRMK